MRIGQRRDLESLEPAELFWPVGWMAMRRADGFGWQIEQTADGRQLAHPSTAKTASMQQKALSPGC